MKSYVDLHLHSIYSDGSWTPSQIVQRAAKYDISVIAICDHDTVSGISEGLEAAQRSGIKLVPAVEISTKWCNGRMHILGYFIDYYDKGINDLMVKMQDARRQRIFKMCEKLAELGKPVDPELVFKIAGDAKSLGRPHVANAMVKLGYVPTLQAAFDIYISHGQPGYVPRWAPEPNEAIDAIHNAGGIASLAHCPVTMGCMDRLDDALALGIDGVEAYYPAHKPHEIQMLNEFAMKNNLIVTGGSDCHGMTRGEPLLGIYKVPYEVYEKLEKRHLSAFAQKSTSITA